MPSITSRFLLTLILVQGAWLMAKDFVIPEINVDIPNAQGMGVPVEVRLLTRKTWTNDYNEIGMQTLNAGKKIQFPQQKTKRAGWLVLRFDWQPLGLPPRTLMLEIRTKKGPRDKAGRWIQPERQEAFYLLGDSSGGNCLNLFRFNASGTRIDIGLDLPATYLDCEDNGQDMAVTEIGQRNINKGQLNFYKFDDDVRMGAQFYQQLGNTPENKPLKDPMVTTYVTNMVTRLVKASDMPDLKFTVTVIDADILNAFAVPGGFIFVYRGLIENTETEAELAGVLAHEIAHVTARHGTEGVTAAISKTVAGLALGELLANEAKERGELIRQVAQTAVMAGTQFWILGGTRKREAEADHLGAQYAWKAGYDPTGIATLFGRWSKERGKKQTRLDQFFSDHPNDDARVAAVTQVDGYFLPQKNDLILSSPEYQRVKQHLKGKKAPPIPADQVGQAVFNAFKSTNETILLNEINAYVQAQEKQ